MDPISQAAADASARANAAGTDRDLHHAAGYTHSVAQGKAQEEGRDADSVRHQHLAAHHQNAGDLLHGDPVSRSANEATAAALTAGQHGRAAMAHRVARDKALEDGREADVAHHEQMIGHHEREAARAAPLGNGRPAGPNGRVTAEQSGTFETPAPRTRANERPTHTDLTGNVFPAGTRVRVNAPGHAAHGKTGVMTGTGPEFGVYHVRAEGAVHAVPAHGLEPVDRRELSKPVGIAGAQSHTEAVTASGPAVRVLAAVKNSEPPPAVTSQPIRRPPEGAGPGRKPWLGPVPGNRDSKPLTRQEPLMAGLSGATGGETSFGAGGRFDLTTPGSGDGEHAAALMDKGDYAGAAAKFRSAAAYHSTMAGQCDDAQAAATAGAVAGDRNGMTGNARRTTVDYLIANGCGCWGEEDRPLLMGFSAERLKSLEANAQGRADEAAVLNALRGEGLSVNGVVVQLAADGTVVGDYRAADGSRPALAELVRNYGTPEEREAWEAAIALTAGERQRLVDSLTANSMPSRRDAAAAAYGKMTMPELRELVASLPPRQPVPGGRGAAPDGRGVRVVPPAALPAPNYSAAGVGPGVVVNAAAGADRRDAPLALPRLKFDNPMESRKRS